MLVSAYRSATGHRAVEDGHLRVITHLDLLFGGQQIGTAMATTDLEQQECGVIIKDAKPAATWGFSSSIREVNVWPTLQLMFLKNTQPYKTKQTISPCKHQNQPTNA